MADSNNVTIELTITEARIICHALSSFVPRKDDEMVSFMIYSRLVRKIDQITGRNETS